MNSTVQRITKQAPQNGKAETMFSQLLAGQLEAMARQMATQFDIPVDKAVEMASQHASTIDLHTVEKPARKRSTRVRKPKALVTAENRCMARVWGTGSGTDQCKCSRGDSSEYCSRHSKQAAICVEACQIDENGKKKGLFCGRIDEFADGTDIAPFSSNGVIRIEWKSMKHLEAISEALENESCRKQTSRRKPKKTNVVAVEINEEQLAEVVANTASKVESDVELGKSFDQVLGEFGLEEEHDSEVEEDSLNVEEWDHNGEFYLVCRDTLLIYSNDGEEIGKWGEGTTSGAAIPDEEEEE